MKLTNHSKSHLHLAAHDAVYFFVALLVLISGLAGMHALELGLFLKILYTVALLPALFSTAVHFTRDLSEFNDHFKA